MTDLSRPFIARPDHWATNAAEAATVRAEPCERVDRDGGIHPGVAVFTGKRPWLVLDAAAALRLAHGLADALTPPPSKGKTMPGPDHFKKEQH